MDEDEEENIWEDLQRRRRQCLDYLQTQQSNAHPKKLSTEDLLERIREIIEHQEFLAEMWKRLEMDIRKGDPSAPLRDHRRINAVDDPYKTWLRRRVAPLFFLQEFFRSVEVDAESDVLEEDDFEDRSCWARS